MAIWFRLSSKTSAPATIEDLTFKSPFSGWPKAIFFSLMLVFAGYASTHMVAAGDTWVALACGRHFYNHGVDTVEPFSANSHHAGPTNETMGAYAAEIRNSVNELSQQGKGSSLKAGVLRWWAGEVGSYPQWPQWKKDALAKWHPTGWINQNWLTHLLFYWISYKSPLADAETRVFNSLVYWKFAMYVIAVFVVYYAARVVKTDVAIAAVLACFAMFVGRSFIDIRPAGFSNLFAPVFLLILLLTTYRSVLYIWLIVPLVVLWCNLHGGYIYVFLMMSAFISMHLLMVLLTRYRSLLHVWLLAPVALSIGVLAVTGKPMVLLILPFCLLLDISLSISDKWFISIGPRGLKHSIAASVTAFVAMVILNPFHLTNLTHTYVISFSKYAKTWREVNEWHGAFEWTNPVGIGQPFLIMCILLAVVVVVWLMLLSLNPDNITRRRQKKLEPGQYVWPKVDLPVLLVMAMTVYMAVKSRRFIPIGAFVACPIIAMMIDQSIRMMAAGQVWVKSRKDMLPPFPSWMLATEAICAVIGIATAAVAQLDSDLWGQNRRWFIVAWIVLGCLMLIPVLYQWMRMHAARSQVAELSVSLPSLPASWRSQVIVVALIALLGFGVGWGWKFKKVYLDPWPSDVKYTSVFMRMTASNIKPFGACDFIRENKLSGNMFNYWTEGGFIAWGQDPDPITGKTPLQLFMDGRAQAAYDVAIYDEWGRILGGGEPALKVYHERRQATNADYQAIGEWLDKTLVKYGVWVVLMPSVEFNDPQKYFTDALERNENWRQLYYDGEQKLLVRFADPRGNQLFTDMLSAKLEFPNVVSRDMSMSSWMVRFDDELALKEGMRRAKEAFTLNPSQETLIISLIAYRHETLRPEIDQMCKDWLEKFTAERKQLQAVDGYRVRLTAALTALDHLTRWSTSSEEKARLAQLRKQWMSEYNQMSEWSRW